MKLFRFAWYTGLAVIVISIILLVSGPRKAVKLPAGFYTPVVAFEFMETRAEVLDLFGHAPSAERASLVSEMDRTNRIDFLYMIAYTLFLVILSAACRVNSGKKWFILPACISLVVLGADVTENIQLLAITAKINEYEISHELYLLRIFTWIKWGGLAGVFLTLVPFMRGRGICGGIITISSLCTAFAGTAAFLHRSVFNEIFAMLVALTFIMLIVFSFINRELYR